MSLFSVLVFIAVAMDLRILYEDYVLPWPMIDLETKNDAVQAIFTWSENGGFGRKFRGESEDKRR